MYSKALGLDGCVFMLFHVLCCWISVNKDVCVSTLCIIYFISEENKLLIPYPPQLKNVTAPPCKMQNFYI